MAITQTGAMYKSLSFDNTSSRSYGVYITGEAVYNAPERAVEMISIPGRNGSFALDQGRFENIEVTYPAGIFAENETDFAAAISDFRNFLCSKKGYCRLTDEYNPSEHRMAVYKSGLEVDPAQLRAGEFNITFECKPQRWLTSGETEVAVDSGDTLTNPTLFESRPLLEATGYGTIEFNGYDITIANATMGNVPLFECGYFPSAQQGSGSIVVSDLFGKLNTGDTITIVSDARQSPYSFIQISDEFRLPTSGGYHFYPESSYTPVITGDTTNLKYSKLAIVKTTGGTLIGMDCYLTFDSLTFTAGTASSYSVQMAVSGNIIDDNTNSDKAFSITCSYTVAYDGDKTFTYTNTSNIVSDASGALTTRSTATRTGTGEGDSSKLAIGQPTYIDCDLGEAYYIDNNEVISLNRYIDLGSNLPTLAPGTNTITYDNTITQLKVTPRWWKV